ncbi:MAG TPA: hypothetical protein VFU69_14165 [Ktedonobacterales bacterium]|nr:hypothetical protein [Ktedonobacterales bacterium]
MAFLMGSPKPSSFPSGRYTHTNPLRRWEGLRVFSAYLPEALRWAVIRAWREALPPPSRLSAPELPSRHRQRPSEASLPYRHPQALSLIGLIELEMSRRAIEAPRESLTRVERNAMLASQGAYVREVYLALAAQIGEAAALAVFRQALETVG